MLDHGDERARQSIGGFDLNIGPMCESCMAMVPTGTRQIGILS
jgi:hypothetical protein